MFANGLYHLPSAKLVLCLRPLTHPQTHTQESESEARAAFYFLILASSLFCDGVRPNPI
jgi:hypothetical protein